MANRLQHETSPYLRQHAENPVDWYPWGQEAFKKAKAEDKPVFLSIGYSTCHWCHVMAHESFEDEEIAALLNRHFVSIKVDREERPDVDTVYMAVCQALTGSGGWPTSLFLTPDRKPFFAGTYFPKTSLGRMVGFRELLTAIHTAWEGDRDSLLKQADRVVAHLSAEPAAVGPADRTLLQRAVAQYKTSYDRVHGGFGQAPKFPAAHNLLFLLYYAQRTGDASCLEMAEHTLTQMARGGLFDQIGGGFCRYSTDEKFLVPHFEKMLYDNALLILAYGQAHRITGKAFYLTVAERTAGYVLTEMTGPEGGFYSAQDADSGGEEGGYYLFTPQEVTDLLGKAEGEAFQSHFDIRPGGNFGGRSIPNLLHSDPEDRSFDRYFPVLQEYRRQRYALGLDDKVLTAWNGLMIAALCDLYRASGKRTYLSAAQRADGFLKNRLSQDNALFVSYREGSRGAPGFLDDYASVIFAQLALHQATQNSVYLERAKELCQVVLEDFRDETAGGFYLYGKAHEGLILRPKETYDGASPSGNGLMAWNLVRLSQLTGEADWTRQAAEQLDFLAGEAARYPTGFAMYLTALLDQEAPPEKVTVVLAQESERAGALAKVPDGALVVLLSRATEEFPLKDGRTTYYVCRGQSCLPPVNDLQEVPENRPLFSQENTDIG